MGTPILISNKVCIVGGSTGRDDARRYTSTDWNIWCVARIYNHVPYATLVFDMHQDSMRWTPNTSNAYLDKKLMLQAPCQDFPEAHILPMQDIIKDFAMGFTSSFSWIIAYAIYRGAQMLDLCGVNMSHESELEAQRPGLFYILGYARARGVHIILPRNSHLRQEIDFPTN